MANVHMILQGKGGVGKSVVAALIAQYMMQQGRKPLCIDTDPTNATFYGYKGLDVRHIQVMEGDDINPLKFDEMVELIGSTTEEDVIVDNGASSFVALANYLVRTEIPELLQEMGHRLIIHTVITGGQAMDDTVGGFSKIITQFPEEARFVVWLNPYWGPITMDGKVFTDFKVYKENREKVSAIIEIPEFQYQTFAKNLSEMFQNKLTFDEALQMPALPIVTRQRLKMMQRDIFKRLGPLAEVA